MATPRAVRWGILGPGLVAQAAVMPAIQQSPGGIIQAVGSRDRARAEAAAAQFGAARACDSYEGVLADPDVDAVYIALPNHRHAEWTVAAAKAGKHVLCEKPLARTAAEAASMVAACDAAGVLLAEAIMYRYHPRLGRLLDLTRSGRFGEVRHVQTAFSFTLAAPDNYRTRVEFGGGALLDVGSYGVSAARWLIGAEPQSVLAAGRFGPGEGIDVQFDAILDFSAGQTAHVFCAFHAAEHQVLTLVGSEAIATVPLTFTAWHSDPAPVVIGRRPDTETIDLPPADPYREMIEHFQVAVRGDEPLRFPASDGVANLAVLDAIRESARTGRRVEVSAPAESSAT